MGVSFTALTPEGEGTKEANLPQNEITGCFGTFRPCRRQLPRGGQVRTKS